MEHLTVPASPTSARTARRFTSQFCERRLVPEPVVADAVLLVSELTSNAVAHARSEVRIRLHLAGSTLRVEVADDSPLLPQRRAAGTDATTGRGLLILDALASRWGATPRSAPPPGKVVWFEIVTT